jgi:hypothetical protein
MHALIGDLTGETTLAEVARAARALGVPVRVVYLSNAEDFFQPTRQSRANIAGLPRDARSVLVRTVMMYGLPRARGSVWHYQTQSLDDYVAKMERRHEYPSHRRMVADLRGPGGERFVDAAGSSRITPELPRWDHRSSSPEARRGERHHEHHHERHAERQAAVGASP